jgi:large subunit ribosomal protein L6
MSRIGKKPIILPAGVAAELKADQLTVKGPKGTLSLQVLPQVQLAITGSEIIVTVSKPDVKRERALWGLFRALVQNMVDGVSKGYVKELDIVGVGFKADVQGKKLVLNLGFSHPINYELPEGLEVKVEKKPERIGILQYQTTLTLTGIDKQLVGQTAAEIRGLKKPEPYKGKGIKYGNEVVLRKAGKSVKAVGK